MRVKVRSAVSLADDQRQHLLQDLRETFHLEPILDENVDPYLVGGMTVQVGDWLYDASLRTQLETLRDQLIARSSHEIQSGRNRFSDSPGD
jgi:F-type H+-transporting ATPase subunit delta